MIELFVLVYTFQDEWWYAIEIDFYISAWRSAVEDWARLVDSWSENDFVDHYPTCGYLIPFGGEPAAISSRDAAMMWPPGT
eukprot:SAG31_NODE_12249_length_956_cov_0.827305_2_plen_81_part_00